MAEPFSRSGNVRNAAKFQHQKQQLRKPTTASASKLHGDSTSAFVTVALQAA
jgi:hypothetical protein